MYRFTPCERQLSMLTITLPNCSVAHITITITVTIAVAVASAHQLRQLRTSQRRNRPHDAQLLPNLPPSDPLTIIEPSDQPAHYAIVAMIMGGSDSVDTQIGSTWGAGGASTTLRGPILADPAVLAYAPCAPARSSNTPPKAEVEAVFPRGLQSADLAPFKYLRQLCRAPAHACSPTYSPACSPERSLALSFSTSFLSRFRSHALP
jgi:hypothetical protein